jgi:hypothetical protein
VPSFVNPLRSPYARSRAARRSSRAVEDSLSEVDGERSDVAVVGVEVSESVGSRDLKMGRV